MIMASSGIEIYRYITFNERCNEMLNTETSKGSSFTSSPL